MKASRKIKQISLAIIVLMIVSVNYSFSQDEYDDMYFSPQDRKEVKFSEEAIKSSNPTESLESKAVTKNVGASDVINPSYSPGDYGTLEENYSAKNINPEYIARYKNNPKDGESAEELTEGDSYYDEYYDRAVMPGEEEASDGKKKYAYPSSYYGGYNATMRTRMYGNPWYDPFYSGGYGPSWSMGLGYTFGYMPGFSMNFGYGTGGGYGYNPYGFYDPWGYYGYSPYMSRFYDPFYSPWAYDPFYSPWRYNSWYSSMRYGYGGYPYYCYPSYGFYSGYTIAYVNTGPTVIKKGTESDRLASPSYRTRVARGADQYSRENQDIANTRTAARRTAVSESQSVANARKAERDFSRSQNEYYSRSESGNATSTVSSNARTRSTISSTSRSSGNTSTSTNMARVRTSRTNSDYSRPSYQSTREQRALSSGRTSWSNSGTYRSSRSSISSYSTSPSRSGGRSSYSGNSGASFRSSSSSGSSSGSYSSGGSSGGSRSSGSSSGGSRSSRGN